MGSFNEFDTVVLTRSFPERGLIAGDVGTIVHVHNPDAFEVEFVTYDGTTVGVISLTTNDVRKTGRGEILHVRDLAETNE